jgi:hypothetical protein
VDEYEVGMNKVEKKLIEQAKKTYKRIHPCGTKDTLSECFTNVDGTIIFWFNTDDQSTHLITCTSQNQSPLS